MPYLLNQYVLQHCLAQQSRNAASFSKTNLCICFHGNEMVQMANNWLDGNHGGQ